ncbi:hypothetical protein [Streptomyces sp. NPDC003943]
MNAIATAPADAAGRPVRLGLWEFTLLVIVNIGVGGVVGLGRTTVPLMAPRPSD